MVGVPIASFSNSCDEGLGGGGVMGWSRGGEGSIYIFSGDGDRTGVDSRAGEGTDVKLG